MAFFEYQAKSKDEEVIKGIVEAENEPAALDILKEKGFSVLNIIQKKESKGLEMSLDFLNRVKAKDLVIFSRQLSVMISANVPLVKSLKIIVQQTVNPRLKMIISDLSDEVEGGARLSSALSRYPRVFTPFYVNIIKSGETSGKLDEILNYLADQQEKDYELMSKIKGAMIYPLFILIGLVLVGFVMMVFVIPKLTDVLKETGTELPLSTKILISSSGFLAHYWWLFLIILGGLIIGGRTLVIKTWAGRYALDYFKIKIPIFGQIFQKIYIIRFCRSFMTLMTGGVEIVSGLKIAADVVGNAVYHDLIMETSVQVQDGNPLASVFLKSDKVPAMVAQMISVAEEVGRLEEVLEKLTDFYSKEVDGLVRNLVTLIEPLIMIFMGIAVGIMVSAIILPMYNLASQF